MDLQQVQYVAVWLRKSRGDEETALDKHRTELLELVNRHGWKYELYEEIGSAESIDWRPELIRLLAQVETGILDAVVVMDLDRFSRGDLSDQARWRKAFESSETLIITPQKVYDLASDETALMADIQGLFARYEYKTIVRRLRQGKRIGAKMGRWTNGPAPMPYVYDAVQRRLVVDPEKRQVYDLIKLRVLENWPLYRIATELNAAGIPSPKGGYWAPNTLHRLITSEVHLGRVVQGKTTGSAHKSKKAAPLRKRPREEWLVVQGVHEPVKTEEEHQRIIELLERRRLTPKRSRAGAQVLSGLIRCGLCGSSMQFLVKLNRIEVKRCQHMDMATGHMCQNRGCNVDVVLRSVDWFLQWHPAQLERNGASTGSRRAELRVELEHRRQALSDLQDGVDRIQDLYIMKRLTKQELEAKLAKQDNEIRKVKDAISRLTEQLASAGPEVQETVNQYRRVLDVLRNPITTNAEKNKELRQVIRRITYTRPIDEIKVDIDPH